MKLLTLTGKYGSIIGNYAMVDDSDYEWLNQWVWCVKYTKGKVTAVSSSSKADENGNFKCIYLHRIITGVTDPKVFVDHKDRNPLNNQRSNLRLCTVLENAKNKKHRTDGTSKYKGVYRHKITGKWGSAIRGDGKSIHLGYHVLEIDAAKAYDEAAIKYHGEFAATNFPLNQQLD